MSFVEKDVDGDEIDVSPMKTMVHIGIQSTGVRGRSQAVWLDADAAVRVAEAILEAVKEIRS